MTVRRDLLQSAKAYFSRQLLLLKFSIVWLGRHFTHVTGSAGAWNTDCVTHVCIMLLLEYDPEDSLVEFQRESDVEEESSETFL